MVYQMKFDHLLTYDVGAPGIGLEVIVKLSDVDMVIPAKLDTGASNSIFERRYGEQLGLLIESGYRQLFSTATGNFVAYGHNLTVNVAGIEFEATVFFAEDEHYNRNVVGRFGGMDHLKVGIVDYEGKLYLSSYDE
jgi:Aspartyl protease